MANWYIRDNAGLGTGWSAVPLWTANTPVTAGQFVRQVGPALNSERVFICGLTNTTGATQPAWVLTKGAKTVDNTTFWIECTGRPAFNGDRVGTPLNTANRSTALPMGAVSISAGSPGAVFIVVLPGTTAATAPTFSTASIGAQTADGTVTWAYVGPNTFPQWSAPFARLVSAMSGSWIAAGDDVWGASDHSETQASAISVSAVGTVLAPVNVWCIPATASLASGPLDLTSDPYAQTPACAQMTTTGASGIGFANTGYFNIYGWVFNCGSGANTASIACTQYGRMERCSFRLLGTVTGSTVAMPHGDVIDCSYGAAHNGARITPTSGRRFRWLAGTAPAVLTHAGLVLPTGLISGGVGVEAVLDGLDLSNMTGTIVGGGATILRVIVTRCKIHPSATPSSTPTDHLQTSDFIDCQSVGGPLSFNQYRVRYEGNLQYGSSPARTGGAIDGKGLQALWIITATSNCKWINPFESFRMAIWNTVVGSPVVVTVYGIWNTAFQPSNDDIWIEAEYLSDSTQPFASFASSGKANYVTAGTPYPVDTSVWTFGTTPFRMSVTVTPQQAGYIYVRIKVARASATFNIDRKIVLS